MAVFSRGFGARRRESDPRLPPGQYLTEDFPVLSAGPTPRIDTGEWAFGIRTECGRGHHLDVGRVHGAADRGRRHRHPLRHPLVEARHVLARRLARHAARPGRDATPTTRWRTPTAATRRICRWRTCAAGRRGSRSSSTASRSIPSTAARRGCSCRTCTSGRARSGCAGSTLHGRRRAGLLGAERLQHARRPLDRRALLVIVGDWRAARVVEVVATRRRRRACCVSRCPAGRGAKPGSTSTSGSPPRTAIRRCGRTRSARTAPATRSSSRVDEIPDGEVSPYLVRDVLPGDELEVQGAARRLLRVARRGSGAGAAHRRRVGDRPADGDGASAARMPARGVPFRLLYSVRTPENAIYRDELRAIRR